MARIKRTSLPKEYQDAVAIAAVAGERNDCTVKAVALVTGASYEKAREVLKALGRRDRKGTTSSVFMAAVRVLGKDFRRVESREITSTYPSPHDTLQHVTSHHPRRFNKVWDKSKTYIMASSTHAFAVVGGETKDWSVNRSLRATAIYEIIEGAK